MNAWTPSSALTAFSARWMEWREQTSGVTMAGKEDASAAPPDPDSPFRWHRTVATGMAVLFVIVAGWTCWIIYSTPQAADFLSYWAAAKLALDGVPANAYDIGKHRAVELAIAPIDGLLPFPYPPPFLLLLVPFGLLSFALAFAAWLIFTGGLYVATVRRTAPLPYSLAHPSALANVLIGQNGFLTASLFIGGTALLERRPFLGGLTLGLMIIKPQLALLLPMIVFAARMWSAMAGAILSAATLSLLALALLGSETFLGFWRILPAYTGFMAGSKVPWDELASPFAFLRWFDVPQGVALLIHGVIATAAGGLVWWSWRSAIPQRVPMLAAATMLVPPYIFTYDALLLVVPLAWFIRRKEYPLLVALLWMLCLLPVASYFDFYAGPNSIPIAAIICLLVLWRQGRDCVPEPANARAATIAP
jgi:alpha-1,2-mannosyltransferase